MKYYLVETEEDTPGGSGFFIIPIYLTLGAICLAVISAVAPFYAIHKSLKFNSKMTRATIWIAGAFATLLALYIIMVFLTSYGYEIFETNITDDLGDNPSMLDGQMFCAPAINVVGGYIMGSIYGSLFTIASISAITLKATGNWK